MRSKEIALTLVETSPAASTTKVGTSVLPGGGMLSRAEKIIVDAALTAGAGGTLDVYLQRKTGTNAWLDWVHFPQLTGGQSKKYTLTVTGEGQMAANLIVEVGGGTDAAPGVALAANNAINCVPNGDVRMVLVSGAGQAAGATSTVTFTPVTERG